MEKKLPVILFISLSFILSFGIIKGVNVCAAKEGTPKDTPPRAKPSNQALKVLVIDPGHGGRDGGASGQHTNEKTVALGVGLQLRGILQKQLPGVKIVMTRATDITQDVRKKARIANAAKGDLFISIHCNSVGAVTKNKKGKSSGSSVRGTETYIWGVDKTHDKQLAMRENASLSVDKASKNEKHLKANAPENEIFFALKTRQYFQRSANLAQAIENQFATIGRSSRQARQRTKGIWVLQATAMPSVLVETGFISTPSEEKYLSSSAGQREIANCIARAILVYKKNIEGKAVASSARKKQTSTTTSVKKK